MNYGPIQNAFTKFIFIFFTMTLKICIDILNKYIDIEKKFDLDFFFITTVK